jgi:hypothetical protein
MYLAQKESEQTRNRDAGQRQEGNGPAPHGQVHKIFRTVTENNTDSKTSACRRLGLKHRSWTSNGAMNMTDSEWTKKLEDGRNVKFIYQELPEDGAFITAQIERHEVVYSVILDKARKPLSREDVESHFKGELSEM